MSSPDQDSSEPTDPEAEPIESDEEVFVHGEGDEDGSSSGSGRSGHRAGRASRRGGGAAPTGGRTRPRGGGSGGPSIPTSGLGEVVSYLLLALGILFLAGIFVAVLYSLRDGFGGPRKEATRRAARRDAELATPLAIELVDGDPEELARSGDFEAAIAALLLRALKQVGWRPVGLGRSRTAREILASVAREDGRRPPLTELVRLQERIAFAGDPATEEGYQRARAWFVAVTETA